MHLDLSNYVKLVNFEENTNKPVVVASFRPPKGGSENLLNHYNCLVSTVGSYIEIFLKLYLGRENVEGESSNIMKLLYKGKYYYTYKPDGKVLFSFFLLDYRHKDNTDDIIQIHVIENLLNKDKDYYGFSVTTKT